MHKGVWLVVCQAPLLAMDQGRALLCKWRKQLNAQGEGPLPQHLHTAQLRVQAAGRAAQAVFGDCLHGLVGLGSCPVVWPDHIRPNHLFLTTVGAGDDKAVRVNMVVPPAWPAGVLFGECSRLFAGGVGCAGGCACCVFAMLLCHCIGACGWATCYVPCFALSRLLVCACFVPACT
jgi:hypothetical protein